MRVIEGVSFFDFMGSDRNDRNLIHFKEKWGSQSQDVFTYVKDFHPIRCLIWDTGKQWMASRLGSGLSRIFRN